MILPFLWHGLVFLIYLIFRVRIIVCHLFICVDFFSQLRLGGSIADGGQNEHAILDDTRADRANDTRIDHSYDTCV